MPWAKNTNYGTRSIRNHFMQYNKPEPVHITKAGTEPDPLDKLRGFLDSEEPEVVLWLRSVWNNQQSAISYKELRGAVLSGDVSSSRLEQWQQDYSILVNTKMAPKWTRSMVTASDSVKPQLGSPNIKPDSYYVKEYAVKHGAQFVTNIVTEQRDALQAVIQKGIHTGQTVDDLSKELRALIGLTKPQAIANKNFHDQMVVSLLKDHPRMTIESAEKKAREAALKYAEKQHRLRAFTIARTDLAMAYSHGQYAAIKQAQLDGLMGKCVKRWLTADNERVCPICGALDKTVIEMDSEFNFKGRDLYDGSKLTPPAHPNCQCTVVYEEIDSPVVESDNARYVETIDLDQSDVLARELPTNTENVQFFVNQPLTSDLSDSSFDTSNRLRLREDTEQFYDVSNKGWPPDFPKVIQLTTIPKMKKHVDYIAAKTGDIEAALNFVDDMLSGKKQKQKVKELGKKYPNALVVGVHAVEKAGKNKIPQVLAQFISEITGIENDNEIVQSVKVGRTGSDAIYRLTFRPKFSGMVQEGREYILVDDVVTGGGTFGELRYYIESNGGSVVSMVSAGAAQFSTNIALSDSTMLALEEKYGIIPLQEFLKELDIYGGNYKYLTESEARTLLGAGSLDAARDRISQARQARNK